MKPGVAEDTAGDHEAAGAVTDATPLAETSDDTVGIPVGLATAGDGVVALSQALLQSLRVVLQLLQFPVSVALRSTCATVAFLMRSTSALQVELRLEVCTVQASARRLYEEIDAFVAVTFVRQVDSFVSTEARVALQVHREVVAFDTSAAKRSRTAVALLALMSDWF